MKNKIDPRLVQQNYNNLPNNKDLPYCIITDLDGTLSMMNGRTPFEGSKCTTDVVVEPVKNILEIYSEKGMPIFVFSGRNSDKGGMEATVNWLHENTNFNYVELCMRKPDDYRKDTIVKQEMFEEYIENQYRVLFVLDDRDMMVDHWRNMGIDCLQVYYGDF